MKVNMEKKRFWNKRAALKKLAGTNDFMLKELERQKILEIVKDKSHVLDIGCGDGHILLELAQQKNCSGVGIDFSENMVKQANTKNTSEKIKFKVFDMKNLPDDFGKFDYIITKRSVCNLDNYKEQKNVFLIIMSMLKKGGQYLMIEDFKEGLDKVNVQRRLLGLKEIEMPWHNLFLSEEQVVTWKSKENKLKKIYQLSGTYYFLSRVIYAKLNQGKSLRYDSKINKLSMLLSQELTDVCVTKLYLWKK